MWFNHTSSCARLCYHWRYAFEYAAEHDKQLAASYVINAQSNRHARCLLCFKMCYEHQITLVLSIIDDNGVTDTTITSNTLHQILIHISYNHVYILGRRRVKQHRRWRNCQHSKLSSLGLKSGLATTRRLAFQEHAPRTTSPRCAPHHQHSRRSRICL